MKLAFSRQISEKFSDIVFHEVEGVFVRYGRTDKNDADNRFS